MVLPRRPLHDVITVTTVGYAEVRPLSPEGKLFSIVLMTGGVGVIFYVLTATMRTIIEGELLTTFLQRRTMKSKWAALDQHYILCGYGRVGKGVARFLNMETAQTVVIDRSPHAVAEADDAGLLYVQGDATQNETLQTASIGKARGLITALGSDSDNVFVTLTAKQLNPGLTVVARSAEPETEDKLRAAGADKVVSPYEIGGRRMANSAVKPLTVDFFDTVLDAPGASPRLAEVELSEDSIGAGNTIREFCLTNNVQVLAMSKPTGQLSVSPADETIVEPGDSVILVGLNTDLKRLEGRE